MNLHQTVQITQIAMPIIITAPPIVALFIYMHSMSEKRSQILDDRLTELSQQFQLLKYRVERYSKIINEATNERAEAYHMLKIEESKTQAAMMACRMAARENKEINSMLHDMHEIIYQYAGPGRSKQTLLKLSQEKMGIQKVDKAVQNYQSAIEGMMVYILQISKKGKTRQVREILTNAIDRIKMHYQRVVEDTHAQERSSPPDPTTQRSDRMVGPRDEGTSVRGRSRSNGRPDDVRHDQQSPLLDRSRASIRRRRHAWRQRAGPIHPRRRAD